MNKLSTEKRMQILHCLVEGNSIRATARLTDTAVNCVVKMLIDAGKACDAYQDAVLRNLPCKRIQCDEILAFCGSKEKNTSLEKKRKGWGDIWTWTALDSEKPDYRHVSTSHTERQNLTMRMSMRRFTRLTNAFSKKVENHAHAVALHFMHYNFCRIHQSLRVTPAMEAGVTDHVWTLEEVVALLDAQ